MVEYGDVCGRTGEPAVIEQQDDGRWHCSGCDATWRTTIVTVGYVDSE